MGNSRPTTRARLIPASTLLPLLGFRFALELLQGEGPEAVEELLELLEALWAGAVEAPRPLTPLAHETGLLEYAQVLRDRGAGHVETRCDCAGGELALTDQLEDRAPAGFRKRLDGRLHAAQILRLSLRKCKLTGQQSCQGGAAHRIGRSAPVARAGEQDPCHVAVRIHKRCTRIAELHPRSQLKRCAPVRTPVRTALRRPDPAADRGAQGGRP